MRADELVRIVDRYLDAVPRSSADVVRIGPFSVFITRGPWGYYARPTLPVSASFSTEEVEAVTIAQRARAQSVAFEWIADTAPGLAHACVGAGLMVTERPLLVCSGHDIAPPTKPTTVMTVVLDATSPHVVDHRRVAQVAFAHGGTSIGGAGPAERDQSPDDEAAVSWSRSRIATGETIAVVALDPSDGVVGVGSAQPVRLDGDIVVAELVGIAVLPIYRRRGIAEALTRTLLTACTEVGVELVLLSAADRDVARIYERVGFRRLATFAEAALPT
jgi:ribosomal protein S18 acetylase RimI-like enzyme